MCNKIPHTLEKTPSVPDASKIQSAIKMYKEDVFRVLQISSKNIKNNKNKTSYENKKDIYEKEMLSALFQDYNNLEVDEKDQLALVIKRFLEKNQSNANTNLKVERKILLEENADLLPSVFAYQNWVYKKEYLPRKSSLQAFYDEYLKPKKDQEEEYDPEEEIPDYDDYD